MNRRQAALAEIALRLSPLADDDAEDALDALCYVREGGIWSEMSEPQRDRIEQHLRAEQERRAMQAQIDEMDADAFADFRDLIA